MAGRAASVPPATADRTVDSPSVERAADVGEEWDAVLLTTDFPPRVGGIAEYHAGLFREAAACGRVTVYSTVSDRSTGGGFERALPKPPERRLGERAGDGLGAVRRINTLAHFSALRRYARRTVATVLARRTSSTRVCVAVWSPLAHFWCKALREARQPYALFAHGLDVIEPLYPTIAPWRAEDYRLAARVIACSSGTAEMAIDRLYLDRTRVRVVHPGIDFSGYDRPERDTIAALRSSLDLGSGPVALSVGRLVRRKGFDVALRAFGGYRQSGGQGAYVVAGDGPERAALESLATELGVRDHVRFLGTVDEKTKLTLYELCDLFVMPNSVLNNVDWEGFGIVFLEAARAGKPALGGNNAGVPDAVAHGRTGLLVDPSDAGAVRDALSRLLSDDALRATMGAAARERASQFDWPVIGERFRGVLAEAW